MSLSEKSTLGAKLKARRLELGISLEEIAAETKVKSSYLQALEEDRFDVFPGETYLLGFLRGFASALDLDSVEVVKQYREQVASVKTEGEQPFPSQPPLEKEPEPLKSQPVNFKLAALFVGIGVLAVFLLWFLVSGPDLQEDRRELPAEEKTLSVEETVAPPVLPEPPQAKEEDVFEEQEAEPVEVDKVEIEPLEPETSPPPVTQAAPPEDSEKDLIQIPPAGGLIRLEALGPGKLEISIDRRSPRRYDLQANIVLSWKVRRFARLHVEDPTMVKVWLDEELLDFSGRSELTFKSSVAD